MFAGVLGAIGNNWVKLDGLLSTSSASSPVTSSTRTVTRGGGSVMFDTVTSDGGTPQYSKNGGAFANITEGLAITLAVGDTLAVRASLISAGMTASFVLRTGLNADSPPVESVTLSRV